MYRLTILPLIIGFILFLSSCESTPLEPLETGTVTFQYSLDNEGYVVVKITNRYNSVIKSFEEGIQPAGEYKIVWDTTDNRGNRIFEGIYFLSVYVDDEILLPKQKIILLNP